jgi:hypothetical protein
MASNFHKQFSCSLPRGLIRAAITFDTLNELNLILNDIPKQQGHITFSAFKNLWSRFLAMLEGIFSY